MGEDWNENESPKKTWSFVKKMACHSFFSSIYIHYLEIS